MKNKKIIKLAIIFLAIIIAGIAVFMIYINLFSSSNSTRGENIKDHKLKNNEINATKDAFKELENLKNIKISTNEKVDSAIIKIFVTLEQDSDFEQVKEISNKAISNFSEENLKFYDIEIFVESLNEESEIYPQIGYKHKTNTEVSW